jgi:hypothetical protein
VGTLIGAFLGFLASLMPQIWQLVVARMSPTPAYQATKAEETLSDLVHDQNQVILQQQQTITKLTAELRTPFFHYFLKALQTSVRPTLTYAIFLLWAVIKITILYYGLFVQHLSSVVLLPILWDENADGMFAAIVCFWFGSRMMSGQSVKLPAKK